MALFMQMVAALTGSDLVVYCGHGSAKKYIKVSPDAGVCEVGHERSLGNFSTTLPPLFGRARSCAGFVRGQPCC
jgi:hypothetical protein